MSEVLIENHTIVVTADTTYRVCPNPDLSKGYCGGAYLSWTDDGKEWCGGFYIAPEAMRAFGNALLAAADKYDQKDEF